MINRNVIPFIAPERESGEVEEIADRAFELWRARGFRNSSPAEDLIRAMWEVRTEKSFDAACSRLYGWRREASKGPATVIAIR